MDRKPPHAHLDVLLRRVAVWQLDGDAVLLDHSYSSEIASNASVTCKDLEAENSVDTGANKPSNTNNTYIDMLASSSGQESGCRRHREITSTVAHQNTV
jgi:hypothetical protein